MLSFLDYNGLQNYHNKNKNYIDEQVPTFVAGDNITITTDTETNKITISSTASGSSIVYAIDAPDTPKDNMVWIG